MRRASYREAVAWIAVNDSVAEDTCSGAYDGPDGDRADNVNPTAVGSLVTAALIADLFGVDQDRIGTDVVNYRIRHRIVRSDGTVRPTDEWIA